MSLLWQRVCAKVTAFACGWSRFWFEAQMEDGRETLRGYAPLRIFRATAGLLMFVFYLIRGMDLEFFFSADGFLPLATLAELMPLDYRWTLLSYFPGVGALWGMHLLFLASLVTLTFGVLPRFSALVAFVLHTSFIHRNLLINFGADSIATFFLLYLCFVKYQPSRKSDGWRAQITGTLSSMALRLLQLQVCIIYGYSGLHKLKGAHWWRGEAIWDVMANPQYAWFDFAWVANFPLVIVVATYSTLLWEIYFPALVWFKKLRPWVLLMGVMIHTGIAVVIGIPFFAVLMVCSYLVFLDVALAERIEVAVRSAIPRFLKRGGGHPEVGVPQTADSVLKTTV